MQNQTEKPDISLNNMFQHFSDLPSGEAQTDPNNLIPDIDNPNTNQIPNIKNPTLDKEITMSEIENAVFHQKNGKACGPDDISAEIIKWSFNTIKKLFTHIIQPTF